MDECRPSIAEVMRAKGYNRRDFLQLCSYAAMLLGLKTTALGKVVAAHMTPAELEEALGPREFRRFTPHTLGTPTQLRAELAKVRRLGYAVNDQETVEGAVVIGAPVFDSTRNCCAATSVSALTVRCPARKRKAIILAVKRTAAEVTKELAALGFNASAALLAGAVVTGV